MALEWLIEIGHSRLKLAAMESSPIRLGDLDALSMPVTGFADYLSSASIPNTAWLCAVPEEHVVEPVLRHLKQAGIVTWQIQSDSVQLPVLHCYPELGVDRWLALQPVWNSLQAAFVLVDSGTATTIDYVDEHGKHQGGWILPGRYASRQGLLYLAPGLERDCNDDGKVDAVLQPAVDTKTSLERGLMLQQAGGLAHVLLTLQRRSDVPVQLILTGGDAANLHRVLLELSTVFRQMPSKTRSDMNSDLELRQPSIWLLPDLVIHGLAMAADRLRTR